MSNNVVLFENDTHQNILLEDFGKGQMVQANVHLIVDGKKVSCWIQAAIKCLKKHYQKSAP